MIMQTILKEISQLNGALQQLLEVLSSLKTVEFNQEKDCWLTSKQVMEVFGISPRTLYNWRQKGALTFNNTTGSLLYLKSDLYKLGKK